MDMAAYGPPCAVEYQPFGHPDPRPNRPALRQNVEQQQQNVTVVAAAGPTTTSSKIMSSYIAVLLAGITLLSGTVVHLVAFALPYWLKLYRGGKGLWYFLYCESDECDTKPVGSDSDHFGPYQGVIPGWFLAVRAMETIGVIASVIACGLFIRIILLTRRGPLSQVTMDRRNREMEHNPLCGLSASGRKCLVYFTALLLLAGLCIIIGLVIIFCNLKSVSSQVDYAVVLSGFSGFTFLIGGTLAAAGMYEIIYKAE